MGTASQWTQTATVTLGLEYAEGGSFPFVQRVKNILSKCVSYLSHALFILILIEFVDGNLGQEVYHLMQSWFGFQTCSPLFWKKG